MRPAKAGRSAVCPETFLIPRLRNRAKAHTFPDCAVEEEYTHSSFAQSRKSTHIPCFRSRGRVHTLLVSAVEEKYIHSSFPQLRRSAYIPRLRNRGIQTSAGRCFSGPYYIQVNKHSLVCTALFAQPSARAACPQVAIQLQQTLLVEQRIEENYLFDGIARFARVCERPYVSPAAGSPPRRKHQ